MQIANVRRGAAGLVFAALVISAPPALAETVTFKVALSAQQEVPPVDAKGAGTATVTYDTSSKQLSWTVTFSDLTGDATAAHFHGPAGPGENAKVIVLIGNKPTSPATGTATLTDAQAADLLAGRWYINVHTAANRSGEIRGQVLKGN